MPLLRGRDFSELDGTDHHEAAVLTQDAANRLWPGQNPLGKRFRMVDDNKDDKKKEVNNWITVVGISADMVQDLQTNEPPPLLFIPYRQVGWNKRPLFVERALFLRPIHAHVGPACARILIPDPRRATAVSTHARFTAVAPPEDNSLMPSASQLK